MHTKTPPQNHDEQATLLPTDPAPSEAISTDPPTLSNLQNSRLQILDLHTPEPLISYNNRIYTCTWASTIGTDVFLASPDLLPAAPNDPFRVVPIHSLPNVSVIGTSCINLTGRPTTITPRNCPPKAQPPSSVPGLATGAIPVFIDTTNPPSPPKASNPEHLPNEDAAPNQALKIPLSPTAANPRRAQTSFLESLIAIKASKGETDQVTVYSTKSNQGTGWRVQRRLADEQALLNRDDEDDDGDIEGLDLGHPSSPPTQADNSDGMARVLASGSENQQAPSPSKRGRYGSRGRQTPRRLGRPRRLKTRKAGGLFRDYVPEVGDAVGADIRAVGGNSTPMRWEDVERLLMRGVEGKVNNGAVEQEHEHRERSKGDGSGDGDVRMEDVR